MISYIIFLINLFDIYITFSDFQCFFIDKNFIKDVLDFIVIIKYALYVFYKYIIIKLHYYYLMIYTIFVLPHVPFLLFILKNFYVIKKTVVWYIRYIKLMSKKRKWWKLYYKFHRIHYFKVLFYILFIGLFILMWRRRQTYLKRSFIIRLLLFYFLAIYLSDFFVVLFDYSIIGYFLALFISFLMVYITLN
jgi:hypothetical protein